VASAAEAAPIDQSDVVLIQAGRPALGEDGGFGGARLSAGTQAAAMRAADRQTEQRASVARTARARLVKLVTVAKKESGINALETATEKTAATTKKERIASAKDNFAKTLADAKLKEEDKSDAAKARFTASVSKAASKESAARVHFRATGFK